MPKHSFLNRTARAALLSTALLACSCMLGPDYQRPDMDVPAAFRNPGGKVTSESIADLPWWKVFRNSELRKLISDALENNKDLSAAVARVEQARESVTITESPLFPNLNYQGGLSRGRNYISGNPSPFGAGGSTNTSGMYGLGVSWELDLWGKIRRQTEASVAQYLATEEARRGVMLSLVTQVSMYYLQLLELDTELTITKKTVASFEDSLKIFQDLLTGDVGTVLETSSAEAALSAAAAQVPLIETQIAQIENALSILTGRAPGKIKREGSLNDVHQTVSIPSGIPCELMNRRPDLRQAEQQLRAANANIGVAITNYFPSFSLTSATGQVSASLKDATMKGSKYWGLGADMTGPLFRAGALNASERQAKAAFMEAKSNYEQTMLKALGEVSDSLISRKKLVEVIFSRERSVKANELAVSTSKARFKEGVSNYYEVLKAQQDLFSVEIALSQTRLAYAQTVVKLYSALGGGWNLDNDAFKKGK